MSTSWLFAVRPEHWETVQSRNIWAVKTESVRDKIGKDDTLIFFLKGSKPPVVVGTYQVMGPWRKVDALTWADELATKRVMYPWQVDISPVDVGAADFAALVPDLTFVTSKQHWHPFTMGSPGNYGRSISEGDFNRITLALRKPPIAYELKQETAKEDDTAAASEVPETQQVCEQNNAVADLMSAVRGTITSEKVIEWTRALRGFQAHSRDEPIDNWASPEDFTRLAELYEYLVNTRMKIGELPRQTEFVAFTGLDKLESATICAFRGLQQQYLPADLEVNLNSHKYTLLKEFFEAQPTGYWIFVVTDHPELPAQEIFNKRMADKFWGLGDKTANRRNVRKGDRAVFAYPSGDAFLGTVTLASDSYTLSDDERSLLSHDNEHFRVNYGVRLAAVKVWQPPRPISKLVDKLAFVKRKQLGPGVYLQGGVRSISKSDFETIVGTDRETIAQTRNVWLCVTNARNWEKCKQTSVWGTKTEEEQRGGKALTYGLYQLRKARSGDILVFHAIGAKGGIRGITQIKGEPFTDDTAIWDGAKFSFRVRFQSIFGNILELPNRVPLNLLKGKMVNTNSGKTITNFGATLTGVSMVPIRQQDYELILSEVYSRNPELKQTEPPKPVETQTRRWTDLKPDEIHEIIFEVLSGDRPLAIDEAVVRRIIHHLMTGNHVILVGPPGTGKTDLARRLLRAASLRVLGKKEFKEAVASYEWGRYEVIGGNSLQSSELDRFNLGCVCASIKDKQLLLIDEFNRADMNKAFGEMFMAIDHNRIALREDEHPKWPSEQEQRSRAIFIPSEWRLICTMNDFDKSLLNELSYGLLRRFAYVEIDTPKIMNDEKEIVLRRVRNELMENVDEATFNETIAREGAFVDKFFEFLFKVRESRKIGVSTSIDVMHYVLSGLTLLRRDNAWQQLNEALVDFLLPQLDRLDIEVIRAVRQATDETFMVNGKQIDELQDFKARLDQMIKKLEELDKLFAAS